MRFLHLMSSSQQHQAFSELQEPSFFHLKTFCAIQEDVFLENFYWQCLLDFLWHLFFQYQPCTDQALTISSSLLIEHLLNLSCHYCLERGLSFQFQTHLVTLIVFNQAKVHSHLFPLQFLNQTFVGSHLLKLLVL